MYLRQGDVLLRKLSPEEMLELSESAKNFLDNTEGLTHPDDVILAYGEVTGHAHRIKSHYGVKSIERDGTIYLLVEQPASLTHEEHDPQELSAGYWVATIQRQWNYSAAMEQRVYD